MPDRIAGCLLAGAVGDALGASIEFDSLRQIRERFGPQGLETFASAYGRVGAITDDTQMLLFTAEGALCAAAAQGGRPSDDAMTAAIHEAYLRWLSTQGMGPRSGGVDTAGGWLHGESVLHSLRAPGNTCVGSLVSGRAGTVGEPLNHSKGCGGVMRVAPLAFVAADPFASACAAAALTHGHPSGYLPAGTLAEVIRRLSDGSALRPAIAAAQERLASAPGHDETTAVIDAALSAADDGPGSAEVVEKIGAGWTGEEALAIALYCVLVEPNPKAALLLAVNHSGDSDSTGAICGNILGAMHGRAAVPAEWLGELEARSIIEQIATDLAMLAAGEVPDPGRYGSALR